MCKNSINAIFRNSPERIKSGREKCHGHFVQGLIATRMGLRLQCEFGAMEKQKTEVAERRLYLQLTWRNQ